MESTNFIILVLFCLQEHEFTFDELSSELKKKNFWPEKHLNPVQFLRRVLQKLKTKGIIAEQFRESPNGFRYQYFSIINKKTKETYLPEN